MINGTALQIHVNDPSVVDDIVRIRFQYANIILKCCCGIALPSVNGHDTVCEYILAIYMRVSGRRGLSECESKAIKKIIYAMM